MGFLEIPYAQDANKIALRFENGSDVLGAFLKFQCGPDVLRALPNQKSCLFKDLRFSPENLRWPGCPQSVVNQYIGSVLTRVNGDILLF